MRLSKARFESAANKLKDLKILVIGDIIIDEYLFGEVNRISPEAPVPIVLVKNEKVTLGGAGNVVKNLASIGIGISIFSRTGMDDKSSLLRELLVKENIGDKDINILSSSNVPTIIKTRVIAAHQQVCRVDREKVNPLTKEEESLVLKNFIKTIDECCAVILSDYDKGYLTPALISEIIKISYDKNKIITVDPQVKHFFLYKNITIMTPNHHEAGGALGRKLVEDKDVEQASKELCKELSAKSMMITRGEKGMALYIPSTDTYYQIPTVAREVFDVTGAGDTVISLYTAFLASGLNEFESALVSNTGAGIVVTRIGASFVTVNELRAALKELQFFE